MAFSLRTSMNSLWKILNMDLTSNYSSCLIWLLIHLRPALHASVTYLHRSSTLAPPQHFVHPQTRVPFPFLISYNLVLGFSSWSCQSLPQCCFSQESFLALTTLTNAYCSLQWIHHGDELTNAAQPKCCKRKDWFPLLYPQYWAYTWHI